MKNNGLYTLRRMIAIGFATLLGLHNNSFAAATEDFSNMSLDQLLQVNVFAASVVSAHIHKKGDWMVSYDFMRMQMAGNRDESADISASELTAATGQYGYMMAPLDMRTDMHMIHVMHAPTDYLTLMVMLPYIKKNMNIMMRNGAKFTSESAGLGDIKLTGNYAFNKQETNWGEQEYALTFGLMLPTGSIEQQGITPMSAGVAIQSPYPMQLGSGTYDVVSGLSYLGFSQKWYWGTQGMATIRIGKNDHDYTLGNKLNVKSWLTRAWSDLFSSFVQLNATVLGNIDGADNALAANAINMMPTASPNQRAYKRMMLSIGTDLIGTNGVFKDHRIGVEFGIPLYQNLDGPQLKMDWVSRIGWQFLF